MLASTRRAGLALALSGISLGAVTATAGAATATWSCRGSALETQLGTNGRVAPVVAASSPCSEGTTGLPNLAEAPGATPVTRARTAFARTSAQPPAGAPITQAVAAEAGGENFEVKLLAGALTIGADAALASASARCAGGVPQFTGSSSVTRLRVNGQEVTADATLDAVADPITGSPLGRVVQVTFNEQLKDAAGITQRAVHVVVLSGAVGSAPLDDLVIAEAKLGSASACDPKASNNADAPTGSRSGGGTPTPFGGSGGAGGSNGSAGAAGFGSAGGPRVCPAGATFDAGRGVCVITAQNSGGQGLVVIGLPFTGPSGGRVVSLATARKRFKSACLRGSGPKFAIVGTNKANRITGTNGRDRILGLGGNDAIDGGRANDCIDGGTGADNLAGGIGADRVLGLSGKDAINGGPGTDRLEGGTGNDTINAAFGQDAVFGGPGVDYVNVATAGKAARVDCGTGRDKVRVNRNETRRTKGCETRFVLRD